MRPSVHPDDPIVTTEHTFERVCDEFLRDRINAFDDAHVRPRAAHEVDRRMRLRHSLWKSKNRGVPVRRFLPRGVVDRQAGVVAELGARTAMRLIFVDPRCPFTRDVDLLLRERRRLRQCAPRPGS